MWIWLLSELGKINSLTKPYTNTWFLFPVDIEEDWIFIFSTQFAPRYYLRERGIVIEWNYLKRLGTERWKHSITDMTYAITYGHCWNHACRDSAVSEVSLPKITVVLSMRSSGCCRPERLSVTCLLIMGSGAAFISDSSDSTEKAYGKNFWKFWLTNRSIDGWWLTPAISKCIPTQQEQKVAVRICPGQTGAQHQNTSGRGCAWYTSSNPYYRRYQSGS